MSNSQHEGINLLNSLFWFLNPVSATTFSFPESAILQRTILCLEVLLGVNTAGATGTHYLIPPVDNPGLCNL